MPCLTISAAWRAVIGCSRGPEVGGATAGACLEQLVSAYPQLRPRIYRADGSLVSHVNVFVDGESIAQRAGLETPCGEDSEVVIVPALAGGAPAR